MAGDKTTTVSRVFSKNKQNVRKISAFVNETVGNFPIFMVYLHNITVNL